MRNALIRTLVTLLAVAGLSAACSVEEPSVSPSIAAAVKQGPGTRLLLVEHTRFAWDRVCIFGPYTQKGTVDSLTGIRGATRRAHEIEFDEIHNVLMFLNERRIVASIAHPRDQGDFDPELVGKCYSTVQADFSIQAPQADGYVGIGSK